MECCPLRGLISLCTLAPLIRLWAILPALRRGWGMTGVETIGRIRFEHFQNGKGIKRIARELGIARDTVRKVLRSGVTEFVLEATVFPTLELSSPNLSWQGNSIPRRISSSSTFRLGRISRRGTHHCVASW